MFLCPLFSGSSGNAAVVDTPGARLLIDAGKPARSLLAALAAAEIPPESINAILITHEHTDHVQGAGVLSRKFSIPIYANAGTWLGMSPLIGEIASRNIRVFETGRDFYIGNTNILPFKTPHDARESVGYAIASGGRRICLLTDVGHVDARLLSYVEGSDLLMIEANHDVDMVKACSYPYVTKRRILSDKGHLSNESCGKALSKLYLSGVRCAILGHLSRENNFESLALTTVRDELHKEDIPDEALALCVAHREQITGVFTVEETHVYQGHLCG